MTVHRISHAAVVVVALLLSACASRPPVPDWALKAQSASERAVKAYLQGQARVAEVEWRKALTEASATGQPNQMARLALLQCASQVAALEFTDCPQYQRYAAGAEPAERAYARYLQVQHTAQDVALLPMAQQATAAQLLKGQSGPWVPAAEAALSQLTAAGVAVRAGHVQLAGVQQAAQLASEQGWRRSAMAWLLLEQRLHQAAGDAASVQAVALRLQVLQNASGENKKK